MGFISGIKMALFEKVSWGVYKLHLIMLIKLSWPNILTSLISLILPVSSTLAVGHIGGDSTALIGAAALGNMFANATGNAVGTGLSMALDTLCSQAFGAKRYKLVGLHCQRAMVILSIACIPIAILWYKAWFILQFIGTKEVADLSQFWIHRLLPSLWPRVMYETYRRYMLSQRIMWPLTVSVGFTVPFHILNTYLFVYKFNWGFSGAAWATSISYWILFSTLVSVSYLRLVFLRRRASAVSSKHVKLNSKEEEEEEEETESGEMEDDTASLGSSVGSNMGLMETDEGEKKWKNTEEEEEDNGDPLHTWPALSTDIFRGWISFLKLGVATALSLVIEWGSFEVNAAIASRLGEVPLAAHAIMCNSASVWYSFPLGVASASTALVGNMLGAGEPDRAKIVARIGLTIALIYGIANGALGLVYKDVLGKLFTEDKEVVAAISKVMLVMWLYGLVDAMKAVGMAILRGSGRPKLTVYGNILSCLVVGYPVAILMVKFDYGLRGLWFGMSTAWMCAATIYAIIIAKTNWQQEVLNAAKRNADALNSTQKGKELSKNGLLLSVVVKGQKDKVGLINNENINNGDDDNNNDFAIGDDDGDKRIFLRESNTSVE